MQSWRSLSYLFLTFYLCHDSVQSHSHCLNPWAGSRLLPDLPMSTVTFPKHESKHNIPLSPPAPKCFPVAPCLQKMTPGARSRSTPSIPFKHRRPHPHPQTLIWGSFWTQEQFPRSALYFLTSRTLHSPFPLPPCQARPSLSS